MHLTFTISSDKRALTVLADTAARKALAELKAEDDEQGCGPFGTDAMMGDVFEWLLCNSELQWIDPAVCGDLTDAPILGILGEVENRKDCPRGCGAVLVGSDGIFIQAAPVVARWGYMSYQVRSPLDDLLTDGAAVFTAP